MAILDTILKAVEAESTLLSTKNFRQPLVDVFYEDVIKNKSKTEVTIFLKQKSRVMKLLNVFVGLFNKNFMSGFITTLFCVIYFTENSKEAEDLSSLEVLAHEWIHVMDNKHLQDSFSKVFGKTIGGLLGSLLFAFLYLFPQSLVPLFLLLAVVFSKWFLLGLILLAPWPAPFRMMYEVRAFRTWLLFSKHFYEISDTKFIVNNVVELLSGWSYYRCWPFKKHLEKMFLDEKAIGTNKDYDLIVDFIHLKMKNNNNSNKE